MRHSRLVFLAMMLVCGGGPAVAVAADGNRVEASELRIAQRQVRSPIVAQRVEGIERLRDTPGVEAARVIVPLGLVDSAPEVRRAAYKTLLAWKDDPQVGPFLLKALNKATRAKGGKGPSCAVPLVAILLGSQVPEVQQGLSKLLDVIVPGSPEGVATVLAVADELGAMGDRQSLVSLRKMTRLKCFSETFACRRAVVQAIVAVRLPEAVEALIALLPEVDGEVRGDVLRHLAALSGQWHGTDAKAWRHWWETHKEHFEFPRLEPGSSAAKASPGAPSFYGLAIQARRMVFVIDVSGSMAGARLAAAKRELMQAIDGLPAESAFNVVAFSNQTTVWRKKLMPATLETQRAADRFVYGLRPGGDTAAYDALEAAFRFDAEAIYFLSDGEPNAGTIPLPAAIVAAVTQANRTRRMSIYTIGIAPGRPAGRWTRS